MAARADVRDHQLEFVDRVVEQGYQAVVTVCPVHRPNGKVIPGAVVVVRRMNMSPPAAMTAPLEPVSDTLPGHFQFETGFVMKGRREDDRRNRLHPDPARPNGDAVVHAAER